MGRPGTSDERLPRAALAARVSRLERRIAALEAEREASEAAARRDRGILAATPIVIRSDRGMQTALAGAIVFALVGVVACLSRRSEAPAPTCPRIESLAPPPAETFGPELQDFTFFGTLASPSSDWAGRGLVRGASCDLLVKRTRNVQDGRVASLTVACGGVPLHVVSVDADAATGRVVEEMESRTFRDESTGLDVLVHHDRWKGSGSEAGGCDLDTREPSGSCHATGADGTTREWTIAWSKAVVLGEKGAQTVVPGPQPTGAQGRVGPESDPR